MLDLVVDFFTNINSYVGFAAGWALVKQPKQVANFYGWVSEKLQGFRK